MDLEKMRCSITKEKENYGGTVPEAFTAFNKVQTSYCEGKMDLYDMQF